MKNPKFIPIEFSPQNAIFKNLQYIPDIADLLFLNNNMLFDQFFELCEENKIEKTIELVRACAPTFWAIVNPKNLELAGVAYLYDWVGDDGLCFSAKVSTCFARKYWGKFAHRAGKLFLRYVFAKYRPIMICADVYEQNRYPRKLLKNLGFNFSYLKPHATIVNGHVTTVLNYCALNGGDDNFLSERYKIPEQTF